MIKVCIVEDDSAEQERLRKFLKLYGEANGCEFVISAYTQAEPFIENYSCDFDIIFFDIELPGTDGMSAAKKIRERDDRVVLIFVTNVARLAIDGYSVQALDYIIKPIEKYHFALKMSRAVARTARRTEREIIVDGEGEVLSLSLPQIVYLEVIGHYVYWHTTSGRVVKEYSTMKNAENRVLRGGGDLCQV